jgi:hypothetical protein
VRFRPAFTLGIGGPKKTLGGSTWEHFWLVVWTPQVTNKCYNNWCQNIKWMLKHWAPPGIAKICKICLPNWTLSFFPALWANARPIMSSIYLLVTLGRLTSFLLFYCFPCLFVAIYCWIFLGMLANKFNIKIWKTNSLICWIIYFWNSPFDE